jgi:hypothetical protein
LAGTGSYHLSAYGYGRGYEQAFRKVCNDTKGEYIIQPFYAQNYLGLVKQYYE